MSEAVDALDIRGQANQLRDEDEPHELSVMSGREDFPGTTTIARGSADYKLIPRSFNWAKT